MTCRRLMAPSGCCCSLTTTIVSHPDERKISSTVARRDVCSQTGTSSANSFRLEVVMNSTNLAEVKGKLCEGSTSSSELKWELTEPEEANLTFLVCVMSKYCSIIALKGSQIEPSNYNYLQFLDALN